MDNSLVKTPKKRVNHEEPLFTFPPHKIEKIKARYWSKVNVRGPKDCWEWQGAVVPGGYGTMTIKHWGEYQPAVHRLSWVIQYNSAIPRGLCVCHTCDNRICCNANHLFLGTLTTNHRDMTLKGNAAHKWRTHKLTEQNKKSIIIDRLTIGTTYPELAKKYKVSYTTIAMSVYHFFKRIKDKSWLPEPLKTRYAHCKSWKEVKALKEKYDLEDASSKNKGTQPL